MPITSIFTRTRDVTPRVIHAHGGAHMGGETTFLAYQRVSAATLGRGTKFLAIYGDRAVLYTRNGNEIPEDDDAPNPDGGYYLLPGREIVAPDNGVNLGSIVSVTVMADGQGNPVTPWVRVVGVTDYEPGEPLTFGLVEFA